MYLMVYKYQYVSYFPRADAQIKRQLYRGPIVF